MGTKILKSENGGYYVATNEDRPLTPLISLEEAKQRQREINEYWEGMEKSKTKPETLTDIPFAPTNEENLKEEDGPIYSKTLQLKWKLDRVGKTIINTRPNILPEPKPTNDQKSEEYEDDDSAEIKNTNIDIRFPKNDIWISVSKELITQKFDEPYKGKDVLFWIHKSIDYQYDEYLFLKNYQLFSPDLEPIQLNEGNFTCIAIKDYVKNIGCGNYYSLSVSISDKNTNVRQFNHFGQEEVGIINIVEFLRTISKYRDWSDYDSKIKPENTQNLETSNERPTEPILIKVPPPQDVPKEDGSLLKEYIKYFGSAPPLSSTAYNGVSGKNEERGKI